MAVCTFFGHRECPDDIRPRLQAVLTDLVENHGVTLFYAGNQGRFDALVRGALEELAAQYPHVNYAVVLAYMPGKNTGYPESDTMLPEGIEEVHPRYALSWRNNWMLSQSDYVVTYVTHSWGGAAQYAQKAGKKGKTVIKLAQQ